MCIRDRSEAANAILSEDSKSNFEANIKAKQGMRGSDKHPKGEVGSNKLDTSVAYGQKDAGMIGQSPERALTDSLPDYLKGTPQATPPGATPPVGAEHDGVGATKPQGQPQETMGRKDIMTPTKSDATDYDSIRDRKPGKLAPQMMQMNKGATFQHYEETEYDDEDTLTEEEKMMMKDKMSKKKMMQDKMKERMKEDMDALLSGENLSEEFVEKASTIFEAAVLARAEEVIIAAEEELAEQFNEAVEQVKEDLAEKLDTYLNYMVEEWVQENEVAISEGLRANVIENFVSGLHNLFKEHYINIPEDKVDVVEHLSTKVDELESELNEQIKASVQLKQELNEHNKKEAIYAACEGLTTQTQIEKMKSLAESIEFTSLEEFTRKLETIKESYFQTPVNNSGSAALNEEVIIEDAPKKSASFDPEIGQYAKTISQTLVK